jgi:hypothetical protein
MTALSFIPRSFYRAFSQAAIAAAKPNNATHEELTYVHAVAEGETLHLLASDQYRIHYTVTGLLDPVDEPIRFALPAKMAADMKTLGWARATVPDIRAGLIVEDSEIELTSASGTQVRYTVNSSEFTLNRQLFPLLARHLREAGDTEHDTIGLNPAYVEGVTKAAKMLGKSTIVLGQRSGSGGVMVYRLSDDITGFRAVVVPLRQPTDGPTGTEAHSDILTGLSAATEVVHKPVTAPAA